MPKFGIHFIVLKKLQEKLDGDGAAARQELLRILNENKFAASLGCIGPDLLFWAPDYDVVENLRDLVTAYDGIMRIYDALDEAVETIEKNIDDGVDYVLDGLEQVPIIGEPVKIAREYGEAIETIKEQFSILADSWKGEIRQALFVRVLGLDAAAPFDNLTLARSLFHGLFQSTLQAGREEMDWYWFEMLHYRKTGDFAKALIRRAESSGDEAQMAYAYAYVSHYATDVVGHPFVNTISGSPYRMNVQRHVVIENFMDQWKWVDEFEGASIRNSLLSTLGFEDVYDLPQNIAKLIVDTLKEVYGGVVHPLRYVNSRNTAGLAEAVGVNPLRDGFLESRDIQTAYIYQRLMLKFLGGQEDRPKPDEPFPGADTYLADMMSQGNLDIPPAPPFPNAGLPQNVDEFFQSLDVWLQAAQAYLDWALDAATAVTNAVGDALSDYLDDPAEETLKLIQALAYAVACMLYDVYRMVHQVLALAGLAYPEPDDAALTNPLAEALITTRHVDYKQFPILKTPGQPHLDTRSYVSVMKPRNDPTTFTYEEGERPATVASHYQSEPNPTPDVFIDIVPLDTALLTDYARASSPQDTRDLQTKNKKHFGNAVDLTLFILDNKDDDELQDVVFCNWNLDGDRGYGYKSWDGVPFTVLKDEMDGAIDGNEALSEVVAQNYSVWTKVVEDDQQEHGSRYESETYVNGKSFDQTLLSSLNISERYIPAMFRRPGSMAAVPLNRWLSMVPRRFLLHTATGFNNFFFCNGLTSTPSSSIRCTIALQKLLNRAFSEIATRKFNIKLIHNYTSPDFGDLCMLADLVEAIPGDAVPGDYLSAILNTKAILDGTALQVVRNPTQVAIIALLHHGMNQDIPLILSGHSQGCIITANAIMVFSSLGQGHRDYLADKVRFFQMEPELLIGTRRLMRGLLKQSLVYIMNNSDPHGTDMLLEAGAGDFPGIPGQPGGLLLEGASMAALRDAFTDPNLLNIEFYEKLLEIVNGAGNDLTALVNYASRVNMRAHYMPVQFEVIENDIAADNFRTDPGSLIDRTVQLSTANSVNESSVKVREFFTAT